jgi:hypothetical protein
MVFVLSIPYEISCHHFSTMSDLAPVVFDIKGIKVGQKGSSPKMILFITSSRICIVLVSILFKRINKKQVFKNENTS